MRATILALSLLAFASSLAAESLWTSKRNNEKAMFADRLATNVGDILMIQVAENTVLTRSASKNTTSSTNINHSIDRFLLGDLSRQTGAGTGHLPDIGIAPNDSFSGEGSYSDTNIVKSKIAVLVVDVQPNGNLIVEGARKVEVQGDTQYLVLRGIIRRDDVMRDNSVFSYKMLNANVEVLGEGDLQTAQRKGWINQLLDTVNIL